MKQIFLIVCINLCIFSSNSLLAEELDGKLNATEINSIRAVSQALLKVRGQERQRIEQDIKPMLEDMNEVKKVLAESIVERDTATNLTDTNVTAAPTFHINGQQNGILAGWWNWLVSFWQKKGSWFESTSIPADAEEKMVRHFDSIKTARDLVAARRSQIESGLPSFWQVWKTPDEHSERSRAAIISVESKLQAIEEESAELRPAKIKELLGELEEESVVDHGSREPTITSITKHFSE
jgi:hypothetical protein